MLVRNLRLSGCDGDLNLHLFVRSRMQCSATWVVFGGFTKAATSCPGEKMASLSPSPYTANQQQTDYWHAAGRTWLHVVEVKVPSRIRKYERLARESVSEMFSGFGTVR
jgi:hypothetical protein